MENLYDIAKNNLSQQVNVKEVKKATILYVIKNVQPKVVFLHSVSFLLGDGGGVGGHQTDSSL